MPVCTKANEAVKILQSVWVEGRTLTQHQAGWLERNGRGETSLEQALWLSGISITPALLAYKGGPRELVKALHRSLPDSATNQEGLTYTEWLVATGLPNRWTLENAWADGQDPTDYRAALEQA